MKKYKVTVLGAGNMGTAIAQVIANNGYKIKLWNYEGDAEPLKQITQFGENKKYLPGIKLSKNISPEPNLANAISEADVVFYVLPSNFMEPLIKRATKYLAANTISVDASKGLDEKSLSIIPEVFKKHMNGKNRLFLASISGPAIAKDMAEGNFTAMSLAVKNTETQKIIQTIMENKNLKLIPTQDFIGVEVAGSLKNVYAIALGLCDGLKYPMNTKASLLVTALKEIGQLVNKMGGRSDTVYGLAGLGDLVGTGLCVASRNRRFGELLASGLNKEDSIKKVGQTVEGINACKVLMRLGIKFKIKLPFAQMVYEIVWQQKNPKEKIKKFLNIISND